MTTWDKKYRYDRACGRTRTVPADPARAHIQSLLDADVPARAIAAAAGICAATLSHLTAGQATIKRATAAKIMSVTLEKVYDLPAGYLPKIGTTRRIHALQAIGWTYAHMEDVLRRHGHKQQPEKIVASRGTRVTADTAEAIRTLYTELSSTPGPSARARSRALGHGFAPPAAWDDDELDNPEARPAPLNEAPADAEHRLNEFAFLARGGENIARAAQRAGYTSPATLERVAHRKKRQDVLRLLALQGAA